MQYFLSHLIYIVIAAVIIGLIGFLAVWAADKSAAMDREKKEDDELKGLEQLENKSCDMGCSGCGLSGSCNREERKEK